MVKRSRLSKVTGKTDINVAGAMVSSSGTMRWGDTYEYGGRRFKMSRLVSLGMKSKNSSTVSLSKKLEADLKGEGLFVAFPLAFLADRLHAEGRL
jgi:hypothetical protein